MARDAAVGDVVDRRYRLRREIARGGMGTVYEGEHVTTRRVVALKLVNGKHATAAVEERLEREAQAIRQLRHPGVVELIDAGMCATHGAFMALEMLLGRTLDGIIASRRRLPVAEVLSIGQQMCDALAFVHARGIVHRDLKPSNVFVAREGTREVIKLFDFGIAAVDTNDPKARKLTGSADLIGTPEYMAPEQLFVEPTDHRADLYAVGVTLFECLAGDVPYGGTYPQVLMKLAQEKRPPRVSSRCDGVPSELDAIIDRALARAPELRFQSAAEMRDALDHVNGATGAKPRAVREVVATTLLQGAGPSLPPPAPEAEARDTDTAPIPLVRRLFERVPYVTIATISLPNGDVVVGRSEDLSLGGMLVRASSAVAQGSIVRVRFTLPIANEDVDLEAMVRWVRGARGGEHALGLQFENLPLDVRRVITSYIQAV